MEITNLQMLLDERLVGDLRYSSLVGKGEKNESAFGVFLFLHKPSLSIEQVLQTYGEPQSRHSDNILTYGRLRIIGEKTDELAG
jgi:hypothetical protein